MFANLPNPRTLGVEPATGDNLGRGQVAMTLQHVSIEPIGTVAGLPIYPMSGGAPGGNGIDFIVDDNDGDDDPFDDEHDDDEDDDGEHEDDRRNRQRARDVDPNSRRQKRAPERRTSRANPRDEPDEDDTADDFDDEQDGNERDDWRPPTREQVERMEKALARNNGELKKRRLIGKAIDRLGIGDDLDAWLLDRGIDPQSGERITGDDEADGDDQEQADGQNRRRGRTAAQVQQDLVRAETRGAARVEQQYHPSMVAFAAEAALREAGFTGKNIMLALKLIDPDQVEARYDDESGWVSVVGLEEQIEPIKEDFPAWFRPTAGERDRTRSRTNGRAPSSRDDRDRDEDGYDEDDRETRRPRRNSGGARQVDGGERRRTGSKPMTWQQRLNQQFKERGL